MDNISLVKDEQSKLDKLVKNIKKDITSKKIPIKNKNIKKFKKTYIRKRPIKKAKAVIYIGHIPHGFYENEIMAYFSQFGKVLSANVVRSKKTGKSRGFGFVEFRNEEVAQIAAETMNNYLMFNRILKCKYIPPEERKLKYTKIDKYDYPKKKNRKMCLLQKKANNEKMTKKNYQAQAKKKILQFKKFFEEKGIDFSIEVNNSLNNGDLATLVKKSNDSINETDDQIGILEIDESDNDIHFTTPPHVKKVIIKSSNSVTKKLSETRKNFEMKLKNKSSGQIERKKKDCLVAKQSKSIAKLKKIKETALKKLKSKNLSEANDQKLEKSTKDEKLNGKSLRSKLKSNIKSKSENLQILKTNEGKKKLLKTK